MINKKIRIKLLSGVCLVYCSNHSARGTVAEHQLHPGAILYLTDFRFRRHKRWRHEQKQVQTASNAKYGKSFRNFTLKPPQLFCKRGQRVKREGRRARELCSTHTNHTLLSHAPLARCSIQTHLFAVDLRAIAPGLSGLPPFHFHF